MKSTADIRKFLLDQMEKCARGEADLAATKAITNLSQQIYNTLNLELKTAVAQAKYGADMKTKPVKFDV